MYHLAILKGGKYTVVYKNDCKDQVKAYRNSLWKGFRFSVLCDKKICITKQIEKLNEKVERQFTLSDISYTDIAKYMLENSDYRHTSIFIDKKKALVHITNFGSTLTRLNLSGKFHTSTIPVIIGDNIEYLVIFTSKAV